jgi:hypothetical protein
MPITFNCTCGKALRVKDELAGKRIRCPVCNATPTVPAAEPQFEVVEEEPPPRPVARPAAKPVARAAPVEDDEDEPRPAKAKKKKADEDDEPDEDEKPKKKSAAKWKKGDDRDDEDEDRPRKKKKKRRPARSESGNSGNRSGYLIGGVVCVLLGLGIAYLSYNSDARRSTGRMIGGIVMAVFGAISAVRGATGNVPDDDEDE